MDEQRFDLLSRRFAMLGTRRQALKALAGAFAGAVIGARSSAAQTCTAQYSPCGSDDQCCAGSVCQYGLCMPGCRIDGAFHNVWTSPPGDSCRQCLPELSTTRWSPANEGMSCWSGDSSAGVTTCQSGVYTGFGPVDCRPQTACHTAGINPATGQCEQGFAPAGTACGIGPMCHGEFYQPADACDGNGYCIGGGSQTVPCAPYVCGDGACTTSCQQDADCASGAHCDGGQCFPDEDLGAPCDEDSDCRSGICAGGVCCNQRCDDPCDICSAKTGGYCQPVACETCHACDDAAGTCEPVPDGTRCANGACQAGVCTPICLELGEPCESAEQCCEGMTCAPNGDPVFDACCVSLGAPCAGEDACCNNVRCASGICGGAGARCRGSGDGCASGVCCGGDRSAECCADGEVCSVNQECVAACGGEGEPCCVESACDASLTCEDGTCTAEVCLDVGAVCASSEECCGELACDSGTCAATCPGVGAGCDTTEECCDGLRCWVNGSLIELECCVAMGDTCAADNDCCDFVFDGGLDRAPVSCSSASGTCGGAGATCADLGDTFSAGCESGVCCGYEPGEKAGRCCDTGEACDVFEQCVASCGADGETCCAGGFCDDGIPCVNGTCVALCAPMGDTCQFDDDCCDNGAVPVSSPVFCGSGTCGGAEARCSGNDTVCDSGICCGSGPSSQCCGVGEGCSINQQCVASCGGEGEICCAGATCDDWLTCELGTCAATCGAPGDICSTSDDCCGIPPDGDIPGAAVSCASGPGICGGGGASCHDPFGRDCVSGSCCGYRPGENTAGQCCESGTMCNVFEQCVASCGAEGEACCAGGFCDDGLGLACVDRTCTAVCLMMGEPCDGTSACCDEENNPDGTPLICGAETCGGYGASCSSPVRCTSGVCCGGICCDDGEACLGGACRAV